MSWQCLCIVTVGVLVVIRFFLPWHVGVVLVPWHCVLFLCRDIVYCFSAVTLGFVFVPWHWVLLLCRDIGFCFCTVTLALLFLCREHCVLLSCRDRHFVLFSCSDITLLCAWQWMVVLFQVTSSSCYSPVVKRMCFLSSDSDDQVNKPRQVQLSIPTEEEAVVKQLLLTLCGI